MKEYETPGGKTVRIIPDGKGKYKVQLATGGELHYLIQGTYTSEREAEKAVLVFLATKEEKVIPRAKSSK